MGDRWSLRSEPTFNSLSDLTQDISTLEKRKLKGLKVDRLILIIHNPGLQGVLLSGPMNRYCSDEPGFKFMLSHELATNLFNL